MKRFEECILFNKKECEFLKSFTNKKKWIDYSTKTKIKTEWSKDVDISIPYRSTRCEVISLVNDENLKDLNDLILSKLQKYGVKNFSSCDFLRYKKGNYMKRHKDTVHGLNTLASKKSISIQLSDSDEYKGGDLLIEDIIANREIGNVVIFDSLKYHEIKEILEGERISLVIFLSEEDIFEQKTKII